MKRFATLGLLAPGTALAHGAHAPVPDAAHGLAHAGPVLVAAVIVLSIGLGLAGRWRP